MRIFDCTLRDGRVDAKCNQYAIQCFHDDAKALFDLLPQLNKFLGRAVAMLRDGKGNVADTWKSGHIGQTTSCASRTKVIIMIASPLTSRWLTSFCMDELASIFDLEYWNLAGLANPTYEACEKDIIARDYSKQIGTLCELRRNLKQLPCDTVILSHIHLNEHNYKLQKLISSYQDTRVFVDFWGDYRPEEADTGYVQKPAEISCPQGQNLYKRIKNKYYRNNFALKSIVNFLRMDRAKYVEWKNKESCRLSYNFYNHYTISTSTGSHFQINLPDYETYLRLENSKEKSLVKLDYILWVDTYYPFHPIFSSINPNVDFGSIAKKYYEILNNLFDQVEKTYNTEIVIAAHPVSNFKQNPFKGRKIFINKTAPLVKYASAVMMHHSHSVIWEILWNKPTSFLTNQYVNYSDLMRQETESMVHLYNMPLHDMETMTPAEMKKMFTPFDASIRKTTIEQLSASHGKTNAELLCDYIAVIHNELISK